MTNEKSRFSAFVSKYIAPALPVLLVLGAVWGILIYTIHSEIQSAISSMTGDVGTMKTEVSELQTGAGKINDRIDNLLRDALERAFPKPTGGATTSELREGFKRADELLQLARSENIRLKPQLVADYGKQVTALSSDPRISALAWKTAKSLLDYRAFLNASLTPIPTRTTELSSDDMHIELEVMALPGRKSVGVMVGGPADAQFVTGPEAAMSVRIGKEGDARAAPKLLIFQINGLAISLDGYHMRNLIIRNAHVVYNGGPLILENVYFVDCTFDLQDNRPAIKLTNAILSHVPVSFSQSTKS